MPIYEYKCLNCGKHIEKRQSVSEAPLTVCEECGGKLEKQWSLSGFQFKGAGWYVTDYSGKKADAPSEKKNTASPTAEKTPAGESTAKPETASNTTKSDAAVSKKD